MSSLGTSDLFAWDNDATLFRAGSTESLQRLFGKLQLQNHVNEVPTATATATSSQYYPPPAVWPFRHCQFVRYALTPNSDATRHLSLPKWMRAAAA